LNVEVVLPQQDVTPAAIQLFEERYLPRVERALGASRDQALELLRTSTKWPSSFAPASELLVSEDGALWLRTTPDWSTKHTWRVFRRDGTLRGVLTLDEGVRVVAAEGDTVIAEVTTDNEIAILKYRLTNRGAAR
jgi:hypothetical protein